MIKRHILLIVLSGLWLLAGSAAAGPKLDYMKLFTEEEAKKPHVRARSVELPHDFLDGQWEGIIAAGDGKTYFSVSSHSPDRNAQFYSYDPKTGTLKHLIDLGAWCGETEEVGKYNTQGKIHSIIYEVDGKLYCSSTSAHRIAERPYSGGHFLSYDLKTGEFEDLGLYPDPKGGLLTMHYEPVYRRLYAISQGEQTLIFYDMKTGQIHRVGSIEDNPHQCRVLVSDEFGNVYGSTWDRVIYKYDPKHKQMSCLLTRIPHDPKAPQPKRDPKSLYWRSTHWGMMLWDPVTKWHYGILCNDEYLFRFRPPKPGSHRAELEGLAQIGFRPSEVQPRFASLGLTRKDRTIYYCSYPIWRSMAHLTSYNIDTGEVKQYGPVVTDANRRVSEIHSLVVGSDGKLHGVGMVWSIEGEDPARPWANRAQCYFHARLLIIDPEKDFRE